MITEKQLNNFKGMRTYGQLLDIKSQVQGIFNELYDMNDDVDTQESKNKVVEAISSVCGLLEGME